MGNLDIAELRSKIDLDGRYVDFAELRSLLSVATVAEDSGVDFSDPSYEGEIRGRCPLCKKARSLSVNINTNRFNCFSKGCRLKGGGVIDFFAKLHNVPSKEASHFVACAYQVGPYTDQPFTPAEKNLKPKPVSKGGDEGDREAGPGNNDASEYVTRAEFEDLQGRFNRLSGMVFGHLLECDPETIAPEEYDPPLTKSHVAQ